MQTPPRSDDLNSIMQCAGPLPPLICREAIDHGFWLHSQSRRLDPDAHADYTTSTAASTLFDRIAGVGRKLVTLAAKDVSGLTWKITANKKSVEYFLDPFLAFRIKRAKRKRGDRTASYPTKRQQLIKSPPRYEAVGQMVLPFHDGQLVPRSEAERLWLTVAFDLDDLAESVSRVWIGEERQRRFIWKLPVVEGEPDVLASLSPPVADQIAMLREIRTA